VTVFQTTDIHGMATPQKQTVPQTPARIGQFDTINQPILPAISLSYPEEHNLRRRRCHVLKKYAAFSQTAMLLPGIAISELRDGQSLMLGNIQNDRFSGKIHAKFTFAANPVEPYDRLIKSRPTFAELIDEC